MKERYLWGGIVIALLCWVGNYLYYQSQQLEEPLFLNHYYEVPSTDHVELKFYYLTNKDYSATISYVDINGIEAYPNSNGGFMWNDQMTPVYEKAFTHQYLRSVTLDLPTSSIADEGSDSVKSFDKMTVFFSNGQTLTADIGEVVISSPNPEQSALNFEATGSSNQHREATTISALQNLTIKQIAFPFTEKISKDIAIKVDKKNLQGIGQNEDTSALDKEWNELPGTLVDSNFNPIAVEAGEKLNVYIKYKPKRASYLKFDLKIYGTTDSGEKFTYYTPVMDDPSLDEKEINRLIEEKQGGKANE